MKPRSGTFPQVFLAVCVLLLVFSASFLPRNLCLRSLIKLTTHRAKVKLLESGIPQKSASFLAELRHKHRAPCHINTHTCIQKEDSGSRPLIKLHTAPPLSLSSPPCSSFNGFLKGTESFSPDARPQLV